MARKTCEVGADARMTIPEAVAREADIKHKKAFCQAENYGKDKILLTIMTRWEPDKRIKGRVQKT